MLVFGILSAKISTSNYFTILMPLSQLKISLHIILTNIICNFVAKNDTMWYIIYL